jgi:hypothetical protein
MRRVISVAACVLGFGCGRIGFDERIDAATGPSLACSPVFVELPGAPLRYHLEATPVDWTSARAGCEGFGPGHRLAVPTTDGERIALATVAESVLADRWWLGGTDAAVEGTWVDTSGAAIAYQPWAMDEPNNFGGAENCLDLLADPAEGAGRTGMFDDRTCTALYAYICACDL